MIESHFFDFTKRNLYLMNLNYFYFNILVNLIFPYIIAINYSLLLVTNEQGISKGGK